MIDITIAIIFLLLTGFFAGSEISVLASSRIRIRTLASENYALAKAAHKVRSSLSRTLAVILVGTNLSVVACSIFVTHFFIKRLPDYTMLAPVITTVVVLLFGEIVPKSICLRRPNSFALWFGFPLLVAGYVLRPVADGVHNLSAGILRGLGVKPNKQSTTRRELETAMREGGIGLRERMIISGVFDFASKPVSKVMIPRVDVKGIAVDEPLQAVLRLAQKTGHSRYPVYQRDMDRIVGIVHVNDLLRLSDKDWSRYARPPLFVPESESCSAVLSRCRVKRTHMAIVLDEYGGTAGIVTVEDLLEELVGEIEDEYDWKRKWNQRRRT